MDGVSNVLPLGTPGILTCAARAYTLCLTATTALLHTPARGFAGDRRCRYRQRTHAVLYQLRQRICGALPRASAHRLARSLLARRCAHAHTHVTRRALTNMAGRVDARGILLLWYRSSLYNCRRLRALARDLPRLPICPAAVRCRTPSSPTIPCFAEKDNPVCRHDTCHFTPHTATRDGSVCDIPVAAHAPPAGLTGHRWLAFSTAPTIVIPPNTTAPATRRRHLPSLPTVPTTTYTHTRTTHVPVYRTAAVCRAVCTLYWFPHVIKRTRALHAAGPVT